MTDTIIYHSDYELKVDYDFTTKKAGRYYVSNLGGFKIKTALEIESQELIPFSELPENTQSNLIEYVRDKLVERLNDMDTDSYNGDDI